MIFLYYNIHVNSRKMFSINLIDVLNTTRQAVVNNVNVTFKLYTLNVSSYFNIN